MSNTAISVTAIAMLLLAGCASVSADKTQPIASAGKDYVHTLKKVNDLALDTSISFTADHLASAERTEANLVNFTDELKVRTEKVSDARQYLDGIADYFFWLETLAKGDQSEATSEALGLAAESLKREPLTLRLTDERKAALTGLAGFVAGQVHSHTVKKALKRDSDTVARALALSEQMLDEQINWLGLRERAARKKRFHEEVLKPFIENAPLDADWKKAWEVEVRNPPVAALLVEAKQSSQELQKQWVNILRGDFSMSELKTSLEKVKSGVEALVLLRQSK